MNLHDQHIAYVLGQEAAKSQFRLNAQRDDEAYATDQYYQDTQAEYVPEYYDDEEAVLGDAELDGGQSTSASAEARGNAETEALRLQCVLEFSDDTCAKQIS